MRDGKHVILYVDDDPDVRAAMGQVLRAGGYVMIEAETGDEGLRLFKEHRPDLILLDLMMEEVDAGTQVLRELRAEGNTAPVFLISSVGDQLTMMTDATELGFAGVFQKPVDNEKLLTALRTRLQPA